MNSGGLGERLRVCEPGRAGAPTGRDTWSREQSEQAVPPDDFWGPLLQGGGPFFIGILNVTPDSFSDGGRFLDPRAALAQGQALAAAGAGMLDLGAESTRPGAEPLDPEQEWSRLEPVLARLRRDLPALPLSVDTRHAGIAEKALAAGAAVINDVTGFSDPAMLKVVAASGCGLIAMRSRSLEGRLWMPAYDEGGPRDAEAAIQELATLRDRLLGAGIGRGRLLLDPGFGFGTTYRGDLALWEALPTLPQRLDWPGSRFCLGLSRKRFVARRFAESASLPPAERDPATALAHRKAEGWGYHVFRTHAVPAGFPPTSPGPALRPWPSGPGTPPR